MTGLVRRFLRDEHGGTAVEYGMIAVLVSIAGIAGLIVIGPAVVDMFTSASDAF